MYTFHTTLLTFPLTSIRAVTQGLLCYDRNIWVNWFLPLANTVMAPFITTLCYVVPMETAHARFIILRKIMEVKYEAGIHGNMQFHRIPKPRRSCCEGRSSSWQAWLSLVSFPSPGFYTMNFHPQLLVFPCLSISDFLTDSYIESIWKRS